MMFDLFVFFSREMGMQLAFFMLMKCYVILSAFQVQGSAGLHLPSLEATVGLIHLKVEALNLKLQRTIRPPLILLQYAPSHHKNFNASFTGSSHPLGKKMDSSAHSPSTSFHQNHWRRRKIRKSSPVPYDLIPSPTSSWQGPSISPSQTPFPSPDSKGSPAPAPSPKSPASHSKARTPPPLVSPASSSLKKMKRTPSPSPILALPPPPPNQDCASLLCTEPLTYSPAGACACVWPIEISLCLSVSLYTFFPLVSELAKEIAASFLLNGSQVRIMGANAANQQLEKTIVLIKLVPLDDQFDAITAFSIYRKFWKRQVLIQTSLFGIYEAVYVRYPGLPPSPPSSPTATATINDQPYPASNNDGRTIKPIGVDVPGRKKNGVPRNMVIVIVLSSITAITVFMGFVWLFFLKYGCCYHLPQQNPHALIPSHEKPSDSAGGVGSLTVGSRASSPSMSFGSSILAYTGTAKIFNTSDVERATNNFDASKIIGEGGFGIVYSGILDDGRKIAVKVLKRDNQHGSQEFLAEVEMLSRLHHRNLVKLIGICTDARSRCLVYELIPNGSVESHLHGADKEASPLDWYARMKIALGAARGLAYLHEDSSPRVIHRDFKSSNILLEHDFTPKVSDFGLARTAQDERNKHISTHVMGTFGYLAPEYAMTGHLLVKSDVYSYGVVLLELLTGRKPVDLSQPPGQENLVAWARPLLTTKEGLETTIDPVLKQNVSFESVVKFAAIASMCVQPEVSHRPFMGEVVQALKLVCNEFDETRELMSRSCSQEDFSIDMDSKNSRISGELGEASQANYPMPGFDPTFDNKIALSTSNLVSEGIGRLESDSFRRQFNSAPLKVGRKRHFWERLRGLSRGSMSDHGFSSIVRR